MVASYRSAAAAAALLLASAGGAGAADLYRGGGLKDMPAAYMHPASWYLRGDFNYAWMDSGDLNRAIVPFETTTIGDAWGVGGGVGYYFGRGVRGDVTFEWRGSSEVTGEGPNKVSTQFDLKSSLLLFNLYYDFRPFERFTPYIGVGLGGVHHRSGGGSIVTCGGVCQDYGDNTNWSAAGALMAGFSFRIDRGHGGFKGGAEPGRLHIDAGYRFLYLGDAHTGNLIGTVFTTPGPRLDDITAHEIRIGLRWDIR